MLPLPVTPTSGHATIHAVVPIPTRWVVVELTAR
jgi:hypothetical protein